MRGKTAFCASLARTVIVTFVSFPLPLITTSLATILCFNRSLLSISTPSFAKLICPALSVASESRTSETPANCSAIILLHNARFCASLTRCLYACAVLLMTDASECILAQRPVTKGGISSIVTLPRLSAASAIGCITLEVSEPSAPKQLSLSLHFPQKFLATSFASFSGEQSDADCAIFSRFLDMS